MQIKYFSVKTTKATETAKTQERVDKEHGRFEERAVWVLPASIVNLNRELIKAWPGLEDGCLVKTTTKRTKISTGETGEETRYFITSLAFEEQYIAKRVMRCIRSHWNIENSLHWCLDVTFGQDRTQCTNADYIKGRTVLNKMAFNFISAQQKEEAERTGKPAPSKPMLMARLSNVENLIQAMTGYFSTKK